MRKVELILDPDCPNVELARERLREALAAENLPLEWTEWDRSAADAPSHARDYGSPTVLVDGDDVSGEGTSADANCCRVYAGGDGIEGAPSVSDISSALRRSDGAASGSNTARLGAAAGLSALAAASLPVVSCPACWPAYAGLLSALGVSFVSYTPFVKPLVGVLLLVSLASLGYRARHRRGYGPLAAGAIGAMAIVVGEWGSSVTYTGAGLLIAASVWNSWPLRRADKCRICQ